MARVFANGQWDRVSLSGRVIRKTQRWYLMLLCLTVRIIRYTSRVSGPIGCSSYWKWSLWVALDKGQRTYIRLVGRQMDYLFSPKARRESDTVLYYIWIRVSDFLYNDHSCYAKRAWRHCQGRCFLECGQRFHKCVTSLWYIWLVFMIYKPF